MSYVHLPPPCMHITNRRKGIHVIHDPRIRPPRKPRRSLRIHPARQIRHRFIWDRRKKKRRLPCRNQLAGFGFVMPVEIKPRPRSRRATQRFHATAQDWSLEPSRLTRSLVTFPPRLRLDRIPRRVPRHGQQPARQRHIPAQPMRLARQDQERRLRLRSHRQHLRHLPRVRLPHSADPHLNFGILISRPIYDPQNGANPGNEMPPALQIQSLPILDARNMDVEALSGLARKPSPAAETCARYARVR